MQPNEPSARLTDRRDIIAVLKAELQFLRQGGYRRSPNCRWKPLFVFEDSPTCLNRLRPQERIPCSECVLMDLVPPGQKNREVPCRFIPLTEEGETVLDFYRCGTQEELETALDKWLTQTIAQLEEPESRKKGDAIPGRGT
jgi:hypothetical protein